MNAFMKCAIAVAALIAIASPAQAQTCEGEGDGVNLCGFVWADTVNVNGTQDDDTNPDEAINTSALPDVTVQLFLWNPVSMAFEPTGADVQTEEGGTFAFFNLEDGLYKIVISSPVGSEPTTANSGDNLTDSDGVADSGGSAAYICIGASACPATPYTPEMPGVPSQDVDFGFRTATRVGPGTGTPGYWKNHPEAWDALGGSVTIGGQVYTWATAREQMGKVSKDKTYSLFSQLVAAKLNQLAGNPDSCIAATILAADAWMVSHPVGSNVAASSAEWQDISEEHGLLDDYNNGRLCAEHRN